MEKIIELLREYYDMYSYVEHNWVICDWEIDEEWEINIYRDLTSEIISKKFGFIKRLVDNDKISVLNIDNRIALSEYKNYERIIIYLAISDNPIKDLIDLLR